MLLKYGRPDKWKHLGLRDANNKVKKKKRKRNF